MTDTDNSDLAAGFDNEFISEIKDDLELLEPDLLTMEKDGKNVDGELVNHAFRAIHSIKGGAGFCGLNDLGALSHSMENVLMRVRDGRLEVSSEMVDALLKGLDKMKLMIEALDSGEVPPYSEEKKDLEAILSPEKPKAETAKEQVEPVESKANLSEKMKPEVVKEPEPHEINPPDSTPLPQPEKKSADIDLEKTDAYWTIITPEDSIFKGKAFDVEASGLNKSVIEAQFVYAVQLDVTKDFLDKKRAVQDFFSDIDNTGDLLFSDLDRDAGPLELQALSDSKAIVIATILDIDFLSEVLEIPNWQIVQFTPAQLQPTVEESTDRARQNDKEPDALDQPVKEKSQALKPSSDNDKVIEPKEQVQSPKKTSAVSAKKSVETIRVNVELITRLMNLAGELVLSRNQLRPMVERYAGEDTVVNGYMQNLNLVTTEIQEDIMRMRMQPVGNLLTRFERIARDMARSLSKKVAYFIEGGDVELDKTVLEGLANPFTHLMRNCVDHGIELPRERLEAGKPETGTIVVKAFHQGGHVHIAIQDDGKGIDPDSIVSMAVQKGILTKAEAEGMTEKEKIHLIFRPGFSTSEEITDISGRGVGMDVVRTNIEKLGGTIDIDASPGEGTTVRIIIPLTLAIVSALIVGTGGYRFAIPQVSVSEVVFLHSGDLTSSVESVGGSDVMRFRERLLPVVRLRNMLNMKTLYKDSRTGQKRLENRKSLSDRRRKSLESSKKLDHRLGKGDRRQKAWGAVYVVVLKVGLNRFGLCVEELFDNEEIVVKPLSDHLKGCRCFSGATILGDGRVIMILDASGMAGYSGLRFEAVNAEEERRLAREKSRISIEAQTRNVIVFSSAKDEYFALDLNTMARLEAIFPRDIHGAGNRRFMEHNRSSISLFYLDDFLPVNPCSSGEEELHVIIPKRFSGKAGIIVNQIIDTMEIRHDLNRDGLNCDGIDGTAFVNGMLVQVLDMKQLNEKIDDKIKVDV